MNHGAYAYNTSKCRCDVCREANRVQGAASRTRRYARLAADPTVARHGTYTTYNNWGCRCDVCREAERLRRNPHPIRRRAGIPPFGREWIHG
jgi:hypothetical protein